MGLQQAAWPRPSRPHARDLTADRSHGAGEPGMGLHPNSRGVGESESQGRSWDCVQRVEAQRHRACTRAQQAHHVVDVPEGALEGVGRQRFLHGGGMDGEGPGNSLLAVRDQPCRSLVKIAGITTRPGEAWMLQVGRNLSDEESGALASKRYLIIDRDAKYTPQFRRLVEEGGTEVIRLPPMSPNLNAYAERFVRAIKDECLNRMIFIGQASLRRAISEYMEHYHRERNHQGIDNRLIYAPAVVGPNDGDIRRRPRLGGMLNFYYRAA